jgi:hypothetical protein
LGSFTFVAGWLKPRTQNFPVSAGSNAGKVTFA